MIIIESKMEINLYYILHLKLLEFNYTFVCHKFLLECNLDYWFLGTSYFICVDILDGDYGCSLFSD